METNPGRYYMLSALKRQYTDRIPTTVLIGPYCSNLTRYHVKDILTDAKKSAAAHLAFYNRFKPDSLVVYNDIYLEVEAIGCELEFPEDRVSHPKSILLEDKLQLAKLKVPDPKKDGRIGPWNIAMHLRGIESLLLDTDDDPEFVHELMKFSTEVVRTLGDALIDARFSPSLGEACASCSLISPKIFQTFIKPYHRELCQHFKSKGAFTALHICGMIDPIMEDIIDTGVNLLSLDAPSSLKQLVNLAAGKLIIMGNVPTSLFGTGPGEEMEEAIRDCIETAAEGSGYILSSGCEIPLNSTEEMIDHFFRYSHRYSKEYMSKLKDRRPNLFQD
jgi:uroporphyrinogen decarboxylase